MEAIPLCLLLNKLHLFSRTQHIFILIQIVPLHVCCMFRPVLRPYSVCTMVDMQTSNTELVFLHHQDSIEQVTEMSIF